MIEHTNGYNPLKYLLLAFCSLYFASVDAQVISIDPPITCPSEETFIFFGNGVTTSIEAADHDADRIQNAYSANDPCRPKVVVAFNQTENFLLDIIEAATQVFGAEYPTILLNVMSGGRASRATNLLAELSPEAYREFNDLLMPKWAQTFIEADGATANTQRLINQYRTYLEEENIGVIVAHSQGNIFANRVLSDLRTDDFELASRLRVIPVASPENTNLGMIADSGVPGSPDNYVTFQEDLVVALISNLRSLAGLPEALAPNRNSLLVGGPELLTNPLAGHDFDKAYFGASSISRVLILAMIERAREELITNEEPGYTQEIVLNVDSNGKDIWTTSVFPVDGTGNNFPGGGRNDEYLQVGGWGDRYHSLIQFNLEGLPTEVSSARIELYVNSSLDSRFTPVGMLIDVVNEDWDWREGGTGRDRERLWWADRPSSSQWSLDASNPLPIPVAGEWYSIDITNLYNGWRSGSNENFGIQLRPLGSPLRARMNYFSSSNSEDESLRPRLVLRPVN